MIAEHGVAMIQGWPDPPGRIGPGRSMASSSSARSGSSTPRRTRATRRRRSTVSREIPRLRHDLREALRRVRGCRTGLTVARSWRVAAVTKERLLLLQVEWLPEQQSRRRSRVGDIAGAIEPCAGLSRFFPRERAPDGGRQCPTRLVAGGQIAPTAGGPSDHGDSASICAASESSVLSWLGLPTIWTARGRPCDENPAGTEAAGRPVTFQRIVNGTHPLSHKYVAVAPRPSMMPAGTAGWDIIGVKSTS